MMHAFNRKVAQPGPEKFRLKCPSCKTVESRAVGKPWEIWERKHSFQCSCGTAKLQLVK